MTIDERRELSGTLMRVFMHGGYVNDVTIHWEKEDLIHIEVSFIPWSAIDVEEVTGVLLDAGSIVDESHKYFRFKDGADPVTVRMSVDLADADWRKTMVRQMSLIIAAELKNSVASDE